MRDCPRDFLHMFHIRVAYDGSKNSPLSAAPSPPPGEVTFTPEMPSNFFTKTEKAASTPPPLTSAYFTDSPSETTFVSNAFFNAVFHSCRWVIDHCNRALIL